MEILIKLPESVDFESRGVEFSFNFADVESEKLADFVVAAVVAGISKAGVDAASSAASYAKDNGMTVEVATSTLVEKRFASWVKGEWTSRGSGDGLSRVEQIAREKVRDAIKASKQLATVYKGKSPEERSAMVEEKWLAQSDEAKDSLIRWAKGELVRRQAAAKAKADALKDADVGIKL